LCGNVWGGGGVARKLMFVKDNSKSFFSTLCKFSVCSVCCSAHIEAISDFVPNILHQRTCLHSLFVFGPSSCSGLQALVEDKHRLPQTLTRRSREVSDLEMAQDRKRKPSAETNGSSNCSRML